MEEFAADFIIDNNNPLQAEYELEEPEHFDCSFELFASGTVWGSIAGDLSNQTDLQNALNSKQNVLTAGDNIQIEGNVISATDTTYTAGTGISIENGVISNTQTSAEWGNIQGDISDQTDLQNALNEKQDTISDLSTIREDASEGASAYSTIQTYGDIVTYNAANFATAAQGALADSALQSGDNISELNNNAGYITGIDSSDVTTALGYTPYDSSNPAGYITAASLPTVNDGKLSLQVNSVDVGEFTANQSTATTVNITVPTDTSDLTNGAGFLINNATGTNALAVGNSSQSTAEGGVALGNGARANSTYSTAIGQDTRATNTNTTVIGRAAKATQARAIAIGSGAEANAQDAIAIKGINNTANTFQVYTYNMLDMSTGLIPDARISTNIARTADMTTADNNLQSQIDNLKARGRFLALWNCATGLAESNPPQSPYTYHAGDYFIIGVVSTANPPVNYKPDGSSYTTGVASTTLETNIVDVDDVYYYDGTTWKLQVNTQKTTSFVNIAGSPYDNTALANALNSKLDLTGGTMTGTLSMENSNIYVYDSSTGDSLDLNTMEIYGSVNNEYIAGQYDLYSEGNFNFQSYDKTSGADWSFGTMGGFGTLNFSTSPDGNTYYTVELNPNNGYLQIPTPAENYSLVNNDAAITAGWLKTYVVPLIPTDTSDLTNGAGYITGITSSDVTTALGYTPYDATNPSGYISGITSGDVTTALGYTPYNSTNPNGYITSSALSGYATETWVGNQGYITGITSGDVTTALGYTPLSDSTKYGADLSYSSNTLQLLDQDGNNLGNSITVDALPTQTGQSGKYLTTDGSSASWGSLPTPTYDAVNERITW